MKTPVTTIGEADPAASKAEPHTAQRTDGADRRAECPRAAPKGNVSIVEEQEGEGPGLLELGPSFNALSFREALSIGSPVSEKIYLLGYSVNRALISAIFLSLLA